MADSPTTEAQNIVAAWQKIMGVTLKPERVQEHLAKIRAWEEQRKAPPNKKSGMTKEALRTEVRLIIAKYQHKEILNDEDCEFFLELLKNHPHYEEKIGRGVESIQVEDGNIKGPCLWINRIDGSRDDFSWNKCIAPKPHTHELIKWLRLLISEQIIKCKQEFFDKHGPTAICEVEGVEISFRDSHVDHKPPATFAALVKTFLENKSLELANITLGDEDIARSWQSFHKQHAVLRVISPKANMETVPLQVRSTNAKIVNP